MKTKITKEGWMIVDGDSHMSRWVEESGRLDHDRYWLPICLSHIPTGGIAIDCGANIGTHTIAYALKAGVSGQVLALDPGKLACECLAFNSETAWRRGNAAPTHMFQTAVGKDFEGVKHVEIENLGASHVERGGTTPCAPLDSFMPLFKRKVDFIKLDIEGWETDALEGGRKLISLHRPILAIEVNQGALQRAGSSRQKLFEALADLRYTMTKFPDAEPWEAPQYDVICKSL